MQGPICSPARPAPRKPTDASSTPSVDETHVVTITIGFGGQTCEVHEVFRGSEQECRYVSAMIPGCGHDSRTISSALVNCGSIKDWELYVSRLQQML